jgi:hypothetical protein
VKRLDKNAERIKVWKTIPNFLDGTLVLVEYYDPNNYRDCCILVRGERGNIYEHWEDVMSLVSDYRPRFLVQLSTPAVVIMLLTLAIVVTCCAVYIIKADVPEPFRAALSAVIGYWLGQSVPVRASG